MESSLHLRTQMSPSELSFQILARVIDDGARRTMVITGGIPGRRAIRWRMFSDRGANDLVPRWDWKTTKLPSHKIRHQPTFNESTCLVGVFEKPPWLEP